MPSGIEADQALAARGLLRSGSAVGQTATGVAQNAGAVSMTAASLQSELGQALREASEVTVCGVASREFITAIQAVASSAHGTPAELPWDVFRYVTPSPTLILANRWNVRLGPVVQQWQSAVTALRNSVQQWQRTPAESGTRDRGFHLLSMDQLYLQMSILVKQRETGRQRVWAAVGPPSVSGVEEYESYEDDAPKFQGIADSIRGWADGASDFLTRQVDCEPVDPRIADVGNELLASGTPTTDPELWKLPVRSLEPYGATPKHGTCLPVAICVVRSRSAGHPVVLLKRRTHMTANDDFGKLSLLSARVLEEDVAVALGVVPFLDRDSTGAIDGMWMAANDPASALTLSREAFIHAGQRELFYSTGLDIPENRFRLRGFRVVDRENTHEQLFFCIFEVILYRREPDELGLAIQWNLGDLRMLSQVGESALYSGTYDEELNRLLLRAREWLVTHVFNEPVPVVPDGP